jgi:hypothetical protein
VTPSWGESGFQLRSGDAEKRKATWPRVLVLIGIFVLALIVSRSCQQEQVQVTEEEAVEIARQEIDFEPTRTNIRFLRQGLDRQPFWYVQFSIPIGPDENLFAKLTIVQVDTESGEIVSVKRQSPEDTAEAKRQAAEQEKALEEAEQAEAEGQPQPAGDAGP